MVNFTHFNPPTQKNTHISACKIVHIYKSATVTVHNYTVTVALHTNILLISHFAPFFSLSSPSRKPTQASLPHHLLLPLMHTNTPTHTDTTTDPAAQNQHRPTIHIDLALPNQQIFNHKIKPTTKSTKNQTHPHTDTPTKIKRAFL